MQQYLLAHDVDSTTLKQNFFSARIRTKYKGPERAQEAERALKHLKTDFEKGVSIGNDEGVDIEDYGHRYVFRLDVSGQMSMWCSVDEDGIKAIYIPTPDNRKKLVIL